MNAGAGASGGGKLGAKKPLQRNSSYSGSLAGGTKTPGGGLNSDML